MKKLLIGTMLLMSVLAMTASAQPRRSGTHDGLTFPARTENVPDSPKIATVSGSSQISLEGRIVAVNLAENSFVVEQWSNQKRFAIPLNSKTRLSADKGTQLAGSKPVFADFKPGQLVKITYTFGPTVLEVRLRKDKSGGKAKPAPTSNEKKSPDDTTSSLINAAFKPIS